MREYCLVNGFSPSDLLRAKPCLPYDAHILKAGRLAGWLCCKPSTMLQATLPPADAIVTRSSIGVSSASSPLGVHEIIGLVNGPIYVVSYPSLPQQIFLCPWTHCQGPLPSSAAPQKPPSMPCLMTQLYVGCDIADKSPMAWHTSSPINSALSQETTMLCTSASHSDSAPRYFIGILLYQRT